MRANMHFHSYYSDGEFPPVEFVNRAKQCGLECIALTDHDTMQGIPSFMAACKTAKINGIPGVEIDCTDSVKINAAESPFEFDSEVLVFFPNQTEQTEWEKTQLYQLLERRREERYQKMLEYLENARKLFHNENLTYEGLVRFKFGNAYQPSCLQLPLSLLRSNLYEYLKKEKAITPEQLRLQLQREFMNLAANPNGAKQKAKLKTIYDYFKYAYFTSKTLGLPIKDKPVLRDILKLAKIDKTYAVLAHPGHIFKDEWEIIIQNSSRLREFFRECRQFGLWGLEIYHYYKNTEKIKEINQLIFTLSQELQLGNTGGSDYHGEREQDGIKHNVFETFSYDFKGWTINL